MSQSHFAVVSFCTELTAFPYVTHQGARRVHGRLPSGCGPERDGTFVCTPSPNLLEGAAVLTLSVQLEQSTTVRILMRDSFSFGSLLESRGDVLLLCRRLFSWRFSGTEERFRLFPTKLGTTGDNALRSEGGQSVVDEVALVWGFSNASISGTADMAKMCLVYKGLARSIYLHFLSRCG